MYWIFFEDYNTVLINYDADDYTLENAEAQVGSQQNRDEEREIAALQLQ